MATRAEVGALTERLRDLGDELHTELVDGGADFTRLSELARELARRAESLAGTFGRVDEVLSAELASGARSGD